MAQAAQRRSGRNDPARTHDSRRFRATTISPPTFFDPISPPAAPTSRPSSMPAEAGPTASSPTASRASARMLRAKGIRREERILICLLDTIDWPTAFLGALKAGVVAVPVNTLMTESDYEFMLTDSRARMLVVSEALYPKFATLIARWRRISQHVVVSGANAHGHDRFEDLIAGCAAGGLHRADHARRHRVLALHLGLDRQAEGRGACACEPEADQRSLCRRRSSASARTTSAIRWPSCSSPTASAMR